MHDYKEIIFKYEPGYFSYHRNPSYKIKISKNRISYKEIKRNDFNKEEIVCWTSKTDPELFERLKLYIGDALFSKSLNVCDGDGTLITVRTKEGIKFEKYVQLSFYENGFDNLADTLRLMLEGVTLPGFLYKPEIEDEEEIEEDEPIKEAEITEDKIRYLLKQYGAKDKEIENFINDLYEK